MGTTVSPWLSVLLIVVGKSPSWFCPFPQPSPKSFIFRCGRPLLVLNVVVDFLFSQALSRWFQPRVPPFRVGDKVGRFVTCFCRIFLLIFRLRFIFLIEGRSVIFIELHKLNGSVPSSHCLQGQVAPEVIQGIFLVLIGRAICHKVIAKTALFPPPVSI